MMIEARIEFDTHAFASKLRTAGFDEGQAAAVTYAIRDIAMSNVATRNDVKEAVHSMTVRIGAAAAFIVAALGALITLAH
jgi:uncharacterized protein with von Willebrand factor type A (vWA) domain